MKEIEFIPFIKQGRLTDTCQCSRLGRRMNGGKLLFRTTPADIRGRHRAGETEEQSWKLYLWKVSTSPKFHYQ